MSSTSLLFRVLNPVMRTVLKSPLHGMVSKQILVITFKGAKTGKEYSTPVSYFMEDSAVYCFTHGTWWRNLEAGAPVKLCLKGREREGFAEIEAEDLQEIAQKLQKMLSVVRSDATFYKVTFDEDGAPNWEQVQKAAAEAVMIRITLR